jgi:murein DD-endopeptidase MepM/ murein hydrolase activator NlpD
MVEVRHVGGLDTRYAHLSSMAVEVGDQVETGDLLGAVGCTGLCTGPHLHFETLEFRTAVNPMSYLTIP